MNEHLKAYLSVYVELVSTGIKPVACLLFQDRYYMEVADFIKNSNLKFKTENHYPGWKIAYIYKEQIMKEIIKELPDKPQTPFEHWVLGKTFGYSDSSIMDFLKTTFT